MDCVLTHEELVRFHFGVLDGQERDELEAHLGTCSECLHAFFALKRSVEGGERPSSAARSRLRAAVEAELEPRELPGWSWWQRPLAVTMAVGAMFLAVLTVESLATLAAERPEIATAARPDP